MLQPTVATPPLKTPVPGSGKQPHELTMERKMAVLAKARVMREKMISRAQELQGLDPAKQYIWVNVREDRQITFQAMGYSVCMDPEVKSPYLQKDLTHRRADVILYEVDRELAEAHHHLNILRGVEQIEAAETGFADSLKRDRIPVFKPNVK